MKQTAAWRRKVREAAKKAGWMREHRVEYDRQNECVSFGILLSIAAGNDVKQFSADKMMSAAYAAAAVLLRVER